MDAKGTVSEAFVPPASQLRNTVLQRLREMRVRFRQLDPQVHVSVAQEPASVQALGNTLSRMLASSYLATSSMASEYEVGPQQQAATVTLVGSVADRPLIFDLVEALSPYLSGAVLVQYNEQMRSGRLELKIAGSPAFYPNGGVQLPPLAGNAQARDNRS